MLTTIDFTYVALRLVRVLLAAVDMTRRAPPRKEPRATHPFVIILVYGRVALI